MKRILTLPAAALVLVASAAGCNPSGTDASVDIHVPVTVRDVERGTVEDLVVATGNLRAAETVQLRAETAGLLRVGANASGRRLAEGDRVRAGQTVAEITGEDVRIAARVDATLKAYEVAQRDYEQAKSLFEEGMIAESEFLPAQSRLEETKLEYERSLLTRERAKLVTPISGVILSMARDEGGTPLADGQRVEAGTVVAQIVPDGGLIAEVDLVGPDIARVKPGLPARVRYIAWDDALFSGRVVRLAPSVDPVTRTLSAEVAVENRDGMLRPGMFVEVAIVAERREDVPVVPREAVAERGGRKVVFTVNGQAAKQNDVALGLGDDAVVEVVSGIEAGDRIVVRGLETLNDGQKIRVTGG